MMAFGMKATKKTKKNQRFLVPIADARFTRSRSAARIAKTTSRKKTRFCPQALVDHYRGVSLSTWFIAG